MARVVDTDSGEDAQVAALQQGSDVGGALGHDAAVGAAAQDRLDDFLGTGVEGEADARSELLACGEVGFASRLPLAGDEHLFLKGERGRHDLDIDRADGGRVERACTLLGKPPDQLLGALRDIDRCAVALLDAADLLGDARAVVEKGEQLGVDRVDRVAELPDVLHG